LASACGSRLSHDEHLSAAGRTVQAAGNTAAGVGDSSGTEGGAPTAGVGSTAVGTGTGSDPGTATGTGTATGASSGTGQTATGGATAAKGAPIRVGMICNCSGIGGASFVPVRDAMKAWVAMINAKGGIKGHPVELLFTDDGSDGGRDLAAAKDFVENRHVVALVNYFGAAGGPPAVAKYAESKNVPIIGGAAIDDTWFKSPMMFPQMTGPDPNYYASAKAMAEHGMDKIAIVYCTEGAVCKENADHFKRNAESLGLKVVYEAGVSLVQPDFTNECINARAAGANAVYPQVDGNSVNRMARSCNRQNYKIKYFVPAPVEPPDPLIEGAVAVTPVFPWTVESGSPALEEYAAAIHKYAPNITKNSWITAGWASGKLLEKAAANVSATPTSQDLLNGLWAMRNETLGGLTPALTFVKGQPAAPPNCGFYMEAKGGHWVAPLGAKLYGCK
jgi:branched-chain amino acid transport system substrate-binding protein